MENEILSWNVMEAIYEVCNLLNNSELEIVKKVEISDENFEDDEELSPFQRRRAERELNELKKRSENFEKYQISLEKIKKYFDTNDFQTYLLCAYISNYFEDSDSSTSFDDIARFFSCPTMKVLMHKKEIDELVEKNLIEEANNGGLRRRRRGLTSQSTKNFTIPSNVIDAILSNSKIKKYESTEESEEFDSVEFVSRFANITSERLDNEESVFQMRRKLRKIEDDFSELEIVKNTMTLVPEFEDRIMFYTVCGDFMETDKGSSLNATLRDLYEPNKKFKVAKLYLDENTVLFKQNLIEFTVKGNMMDSRLTITDKGREFLLGENAELFEKKMTGVEMLEPKKIHEKELFYSNENQKEIDRLKNALTKGTFKNIQKRLQKQNLPSGVAVLLYGAAGTGKTESVLQIAKKTGRQIYHVDISNTKSCWFGESEKIVKKIFSTYKRICEINKKKGKLAPILLFNEADAIFSKRKDVSRSNTAQTENAIQNIILEELESMQGILIATTNLADNLDSAFERRFLFKIKFERPSVEAKSKIWKSKLSWLDDEDCEIFARNYDLSGGEIDNICRKIAMDEVITGEKPTIEQIDEFCKNEKLNSKIERHLGFAC